ncbi:MAG: hypothetical protein mread185_000620 [Mycoplasmataceae bacterium]|nr:MAG: hypothetical protein mread185_000620 [Mycoplasmataceae bacterium]
MSRQIYQYGEIYWVKFDEQTVGTELAVRIRQSLSPR